MANNRNNTEWIFKSGGYSVRHGVVYNKEGKKLKQRPDGKYKICHAGKETTTTIAALEAIVSGSEIKYIHEDNLDNDSMSRIFGWRAAGHSWLIIAQCIYKESRHIKDSDFWDRKVKNLSQHYSNRGKKLGLLLGRHCQYIDILEKGEKRGFEVYDCKLLKATIYRKGNEIIVEDDSTREKEYTNIYAFFSKKLAIKYF
jgi:hypothetical protein